jgi:hypothetical protein
MESHTIAVGVMLVSKKAVESERLSRVGPVLVTRKNPPATAVGFVPNILCN